jgi:competence protein ComEC
MRFWNRYPFFRLIIPFSLGILAAIYLPKPDFVNFFLLVVVNSALFLAALILHLFLTYAHRWSQGVAIYLFAAVAGYSLTIVQTDRYHHNHFAHFLKDHAQVVVLRISEPPSERERSVRVFGKVQYVLDSTAQERTAGKLLLYLEKDSAALNLRYGDQLILNTRISPTQPPGNPHQFNYSRFLANSRVYHQAYARQDNWHRIAGKKVNPVFDLSFRAREYMMQVLERNGLTGNEFAVISAILLGYDDLMEPELRELYAGAGALHVLCVSGLHVGIIFFIMSFMMSRLSRKRSGRIVKFLALMLSIWVYAFITGLSPSVMRASVMFSLFSWRELSKEKSNPYNVLAASAFIILTIDPYLITKIGFQLSYSAVLAIISMFDPIYKLLVFKNPVADYFWKLAVVSVAAQAGTFPLAIFYFNQFPLYFLITNFVVIPVVWLILYAGIFTLMLAAISGWLSFLAGKLLFYLVWFLNKSVELINTLPNAKIDGLVMILPQVIAVYLIIILIFRMFIRKEASYLLAASVIGVLLAGSFVWQRADTLQQKQVVVYQVNGHTAVDLIFGNKLFALADSNLVENKRALAFNIEGNRLHSGAAILHQKLLHPSMISLPAQSDIPVSYYAPGLIVAANTRIAIVDEHFADHQPEQPLPVDLVLMRNNPAIPISRLAEMFSFGKLVFDASNSHWVVQRWRSYCDEHDIAYYDIRENGAYVAGLR